jgi:hypothetical protein
MKVKDLIKELEKFEGNEKVCFTHVVGKETLELLFDWIDFDNYDQAVPIVDIFLKGE